MDIWEKASGLRRQGRVPSIADFEQQLVAAKLEKASIATVAAKTSPEDMSVRCARSCIGLNLVLLVHAADDAKFTQDCRSHEVRRLCMRSDLRSARPSPRHSPPQA